MREKLLRIPNTVHTAKQLWQPTFIQFANISPALFQIPTTVKNVGSAELTKEMLSTVMYAMFACISGLKIYTNAYPTQTMIRAAFVLRMLFGAV